MLETNLITDLNFGHITFYDVVIQASFHLTHAPHTILTTICQVNLYESVASFILVLHWLFLCTPVTWITHLYILGQVETFLDSSTKFSLASPLSGSTRIRLHLKLFLERFVLRLIYATADEADAYMFTDVFFCFFVFCFFSVHHKNTRQPFSGTAERIFMNDSGENVVSNVLPKWGLGPRLFFGGLKTTQCALGADAWRVTQN